MQTTEKIKITGWQPVIKPGHCPHCGSPPREHIVEDYSPIWHDGNVMCKLCKKKVRDYDAG